MRKYYTRACNFYYGNYAKNLIKNRKALALTGNSNIAFDQIEVFERKGRGKVKNYVYPKYYDNVYDDEPIRGETFSSGEIEINVELFDGKGYSQEIPYYC